MNVSAINDDVDVVRRAMAVASAGRNSFDILAMAGMMHRTLAELPFALIVGNVGSCSSEGMVAGTIAQRLLIEPDPRVGVCKLIGGIAPTRAEIDVAGHMLRTIDPAHPLAAVRNGDVVWVASPTNLQRDQFGHFVCELEGTEDSHEVVLLGRADPFAHNGHGRVDIKGGHATVRLIRGCGYLDPAADMSTTFWTPPTVIVLLRDPQTEL